VGDSRRQRRWRDLVVDCERPAHLARFWAAVLRWDPPAWDEDDLRALRDAGISNPEDDPTVFIGEADANRPRICFQRVPEPKTGKNRIHLDVNVDKRSEVDVFVRLGATVVAEHEGWTVLVDPERNEFCAVMD
jgi:glyoxalase superfamily protein